MVARLGYKDEAISIATLKLKLQVVVIIDDDEYVHLKVGRYLGSNREEKVGRYKRGRVKRKERWTIER